MLPWVVLDRVKKIRVLFQRSDPRQTVSYMYILPRLEEA